MNQTKIAICSCARLKSTRCKNKMSRNFNKSNLTDIVLNKLYNIKKKSKQFDVFFAGYERFFFDRAKKYKVPFVKRTKKSSIIDSPASEIYNFFNKLDYDFFFLRNACMPFLKTSTIIKLAKICKTKKKACFGVFLKKNFFLDQKGKSINFDKNMKVINTKNVKPIREFGHCFYFFNKNYFKKNGVFWNWNKVEYINLNDSIEFYDIDTEEQFNLANSISKVIKSA